MERAARRGDIKFDMDGLKETADDILEGVAEAGSRIRYDAADRFRDEVVGRIQEAIRLGHQNPQYRSSLMTILFILRKYTQKVSLAASAIPSDASITVNKPTIEVDIHLMRTLGDLKTLLERCASGTSLDPLLGSLESLIVHVSTATIETTAKNNLQEFFTDLGTWFDTALTHTEYAISREGTSSLEMIYNRARTLLTNFNTPWSQDLHLLSSLTDSFIAALSHDRAITRLMNAFDAFSVHLKNLRRDALTASVRAHRK